MPRAQFLTACLTSFSLLVTTPLDAAPANPIGVHIIAMGSYAYTQEGQPQGLMVNLVKALLQQSGVESRIKVMDKVDALNIARESNVTGLLIAADIETLPEGFRQILELTRLELGILYSQNANPNTPLGSIGGLEFGIRNQHPLPLEPIESYSQGLRLLAQNRLSGVLGGIDGLINSLVETTPTLPFLIGDTQCQSIWLLTASPLPDATAKALRQAAASSGFRRIEAQLYQINRHRWPQPCR